MECEGVWFKPAGDFVREMQLKESRLWDWCWGWDLGISEIGVSLNL